MLTLKLYIDNILIRIVFKVIAYAQILMYHRPIQAYGLYVLLVYLLL